MTVLAPPRTVATVVGGCVAVVVGLGVLTRITDVTQFELDSFRWFNDAPDGLARPLWSIMQLGSFWGALLIGMVVMALLRGGRGAAAAGIAAFTAWLLARIVKELVGRGRPAEYLTSVHTRFEAAASGNGYVSGHTAVAFAVATVIAPSLPAPWRWFPYVLAGLVGLARMYFGAHLPLDVVGGAALGVATGLVARTVCAVGPREEQE